MGKSFLLQFLVYGGSAYLILLTFMYFYQEALIFPRHGVAFEAIDTTQYPLMERLALTTADNTRLDGLLINTEKENPPLILAFQGNAHDALGFTTFLRRVFGPDIAVAAANYRGYGQSGGKPSQKALLADALLLYDTMTKKIQPSAVYIVGISLGSGISTYVTKNRKVNGLILLSPYDSVESIAKKNYPYLPVKWLLKHPFNSADFIKDNPVPVAILRAGQDKIIPAAHTDALKKNITNLVREHTFPKSDHNNLLNQPDLPDILREVLQKF